MQGIRQRYNCVAVAFYNIYRATITNCPLTPYESYVFRMIQGYFPKLAYKNPFEPAYTRP